MNRTIKYIFAATILFIAPPIFACDYPARVSIVNGATATKDEMLESQTAVKKYVADMQTYLDCIVEEEKAARALIEDLKPEDEQQREDMLNKKYNAAVEEMEKVAADFNAEVQTYKARDDT